ncbi:MAG TPA: hypothetical protein VF364_09805 [Candidatus Limnocylindria bacterium]
MNDFLLVILLLAVVVIAAYFYLKRRQQHIHVDPAGGSVEHRHQKSPTDPLTDHEHDLDTPPR